MMVMIAAVLLLTETGCKTHNEPFTVTGTWEVDQTTTDDDGNTESKTVRYEFKGSEFDGTVATVPPLSAGIFSGEYHVEGNEIVFSYARGRGPAWSSTTYTGDLYPGIETIYGTLAGNDTFSANVERTWTGSFVARKIESDSI